MNTSTILFSVISTLSFSACSNNLPILVTATAEDPALHSSLNKPIDQSPQLTLSSVAKRVQANNPQLRAASLRLKEAQAHITQSGLLSNPELGVGMNKSIPGSEGGMAVSFSQRFPITNRLSLEKRISRQQYEIAKEEIHTARKNLTTEAQLIAIEILHTRERIKQLEAQTKLLDSFASFIDQAAARGELSSLEANQVKVEAATLRSKQAQLSGRDEILNNQLKSFLGMRANTPLMLSGSLPIAQLPKHSLSLNARPEYRAKLLEIEQSKEAIALAKANRYQDIEASAFGAVKREEDAPDGIETEGEVGVELTIPLQLYNKNAGNIEAARARASRSLLEKNALALEINQQASNQRSEMQNWLNQSHKLSSTLIPLADKNAKQLETAYRNGQAPFTSVLTARQQQLELQSQNVDNLEAFHKARVRYFSATGREQSAF